MCPNELKTLAHFSFGTFQFIFSTPIWGPSICCLSKRIYLFSACHSGCHFHRGSKHIFTRIERRKYSYTFFALLFSSLNNEWLAIICPWQWHPQKGTHTKKLTRSSSYNSINRSGTCPCIKFAASTDSTEKTHFFLSERADFPCFTPLKRSSQQRHFLFYFFTMALKRQGLEMMWFFNHSTVL